jgi:hypothetical protein
MSYSNVADWLSSDNQITSRQAGQALNQPISNYNRQYFERSSAGFVDTISTVGGNSISLNDLEGQVASHSIFIDELSLEVEKLKMENKEIKRELEQLKADIRLISLA